MSRRISLPISPPATQAAKAVSHSIGVNLDEFGFDVAFDDVLSKLDLDKLVDVAATKGPGEAGKGARAVGQREHVATPKHEDMAIEQTAAMQEAEATRKLDQLRGKVGRFKLQIAALKQERDTIAKAALEKAAQQELQIATQRREITGLEQEKVCAAEAATEQAALQEAEVGRLRLQVAALKQESDTMAKAAEEKAAKQELQIATQSREITELEQAKQNMLKTAKEKEEAAANATKEQEEQEQEQEEAMGEVEAEVAAKAAKEQEIEKEEAVATTVKEQKMELMAKSAKQKGQEESAATAAKQLEREQPSPKATHRVLGLAVAEGTLYASCSNHQLWKIDPATKRWQNIGRAERVVSLAANGGNLFALDQRKNIWVMCLHSAAVHRRWVEIGRAPAHDGKLLKVSAIAAADDYMYATTKTGLWRRSIHTTDDLRVEFTSEWTGFRPAVDVVALTLQHRTLYACCPNKQLWTMDVTARVGWTACGQLSGFTLSKSALVAMDGGLFAADTNGRVWTRGLTQTDDFWQEFGELPKPAHSPAKVVAEPSPRGPARADEASGTHKRQRQGQWVSAFFRNQEWIPGKITAIHTAGSTSYDVHFPQKGATQRNMTATRHYTGAPPSHTRARQSPATGALANARAVRCEQTVLAPFLGAEMRPGVVLGVDSQNKCCDVEFLGLGTPGLARGDITGHAIPWASVFPCRQMESGLRPYLAILDEFYAMPQNSIFRRPVRELFPTIDLVGYYDKIQHPSDLGTVRICANAGFYNGRASELVRDSERVWSNCVLFNGARSEYGALARDFS